MGFGISDNRPKSYSASLFIRDPVSLNANIAKRKNGSTNTVRVQLRDQNGNAALILRDKQGNPRIKLEVTKKGKPSIKILNASGNVISQLPSK